jgi:DNA polymerase-4
LWGVGRVTGLKFDRIGIQTIGELRRLPVKELTGLFGSSGEHFWRLAHGLDERAVIPDREAKSISNEMTFPEDIFDPEHLRSLLVEMVEQVGRRLRRHQLKGRTVEIKVRFADFHTITRSLTLDQPTDITQEMLCAGLELLTTKVSLNGRGVRLLGFGIHGFDGPLNCQRQMFDEPERDRQRQIDGVADQIAQRFGTSAIHRAIIEREKQH